MVFAGGEFVGRNDRPFVLPCSQIRGTVLINNFLNGKNSVSSVVILNLDGDIGNTARLFAAICQDVPDTVAHQELI